MVTFASRTIFSFPVLVAAVHAALILLLSGLRAAGMDSVSAILVEPPRRSMRARVSLPVSILTIGLLLVAAVPPWTRHRQLRLAMNCVVSTWRAGILQAVVARSLSLDQMFGVLAAAAFLANGNDNDLMHYTGIAVPVLAFGVFRGQLDAAGYTLLSLYVAMCALAWAGSSHWKQRVSAKLGPSALLTPLVAVFVVLRATCL
jgi:hypothetical protein